MSKFFIENGWNYKPFYFERMNIKTHVFLKVKYILHKTRKKVKKTIDFEWKKNNIHPSKRETRQTGTTNTFEKKPLQFIFTIMTIPQTFAATIWYYNMRYLETQKEEYKEVNKFLHHLDRMEMPYWTATQEKKERVFVQLYL